MRLRQLHRERVTVAEGSLSRLLARATEPFGIITAYRVAYPKPVNIQRNRDLRAALNAAKMGVHQLVGHWRECQDTSIPYDQCPPEQLVDTIERSYFVQKPGLMPQAQFEKILIDLMAEYEQNAIIISDGHQTCTVNNAGHRTVVGTDVALGKLGEVYSQHVLQHNLPFVFEGVEAPTSIIGYYAAVASGLRPPSIKLKQIDLLVETVN